MSKLKVDDAAKAVVKLFENSEKRFSVSKFENF